MFFRALLAGKDYAGCAVSNLATIELSDGPVDNRIELVIGTETALGKTPVPRLRVGVVAGIAKIDFRDARQMVGVDTVALIVLLSDAVKQMRPWEITGGCFLALPGRRTR